MESGSTRGFANLRSRKSEGIATGETEALKAVSILTSCNEAVLLRGKTCASNRYSPSPPLLRSWDLHMRRRRDRSYDAEIRS